MESKIQEMELRLRQLLVKEIMGKYLPTDLRAELYDISMTLSTIATEAPKGRLVQSANYELEAN